MGQNGVPFDVEKISGTDTAKIGLSRKITGPTVTFRIGITLQCGKQYKKT